MQNGEVSLCLVPIVLNLWSSEMVQKSSLNRRDLLKSAAISASLPLMGAEPKSLFGSRQPESGLGMNVVLFMTDQERSIQHFPANWEQANLPGMTRLKSNGLSFENAFTNSCMCSPARST